MTSEQNKSINEDELIKEWIKYAQSNQYAPVQNMNKVINCIYEYLDTFCDDTITSIVEDLIYYIKEELDKKYLIEYIKNDEEFQEFRALNKGDE